MPASLQTRNSKRQHDQNARYELRSESENESNHDHFLIFHRPYAIKKLKKTIIAVTAIVKSMDRKAIRLRT